jgi:hypothetical protein
MPRLSASVISNREAITTRNFIAGMTMDQANAELVKLDGMKMNPKRLKEIFDEVQEAKVTVAPGAGESLEDIATINAQMKSAVESAGPFKEPVVLAMDRPSPSIFDAPQPVVSSEGCMTIRELIKTIESNQFPAR